LKTLATKPKAAAVSFAKAAKEFASANRKRLARDRQETRGKWESLRLGDSKFLPTDVIDQ
jgi:hypothetical protein